jgi:uncharacterized membrane protein
MNSLTAQQNNSRRWTILCWTSLFALVCSRQLQPGINITALMWALIFSLPLLLCLRGLVRGSRYTYKWATLCVLPYFVVGITESVANVPLRNWALLLLGASLAWFFAMLAFLRVTPPPVQDQP